MERNLDLMAALKSPLNDGKWYIKLLLLLISCLIFPFAVGYVLRAARQAAINPNGPMPEFEDWGGMFVDGLKLCVVQFVYFLPGMLIMIIAAVLGGGLSSLGGDNGSAGGVVVALVGMLAGGLVCCVCGVVACVAFVVLLDSSRPWTAAFDFGGIFSMVKSNMGTVLKFFVMCFIVNLIFSFVGSLTVILSLVTSPFSMFVSAKLYGQLARCLMPATFE